MAHYTAKALVLSAHPWGDADKIVTLFTEERGKVRAVAFGCRRPRSPLAGGLQMFNELDVRLAPGPKLDTVKQCALRHHFRKLSEDLSAMAYGAFVAELAAEISPEHDPMPELYGLLREIFAAFEERNPRLVALASAYQILESSGMQPRYTHCVACGKPAEGEMHFSASEGGVLCSSCGKGFPAFAGETFAFIRQMVHLDWARPPSFSVRKTELLQAEKLLLGYLRYLFDKPLNSLGFIQQVTGAPDGRASITKEESSSQ